LGNHRFVHGEDTIELLCSLISAGCRVNQARTIKNGGKKRNKEKETDKKEPKKKQRGKKQRKKKKRKSKGSKKRRHCISHRSTRKVGRGRVIFAVVVGQNVMRTDKHASTQKKTKTTCILASLNGYVMFQTISY